MINYTSLSDSDLVILLRSDDSQAFGELYDRYFGLLYIHAFNRLRNKEEAKDIVQELFTFLWENHSTIEFKTNLSNYLYTATRNRILNLISRKQVHERYKLALPEFILTNGFTDHLARERQLTEIIEKEMQALPPKMRAVFEMSRKYHMTYKEIAGQLDLSEQSVRSHVKNALKILRVKLGVVAYLTFILFKYFFLPPYLPGYLSIAYTTASNQLRQKIDIQDLLNKYNAGIITDEERILLEDWYAQWEPEHQHLSADEIEQLKSTVWKSLHANNKSTIIKRLWPRISIVASVVLCLSISAYYFIPGTKTSQQQFVAKAQKQDIAPGSNKAILTLNNGVKINLNSQSNGTIAKQGNAKVIKMANGQLAYTSQEVDTLSVVYNTLSTPRGGKYDLVLSDGTKVWLNSASSISYPTVFKGINRTVSITGEVYFDIVHDAKHPFKVNFKGHVIEDIGTQFNINAYDDEPIIKTTLVSGSIKLSKDSKSITLRPGQQSITSLSNTNIVVTDADINEATAWKNGLFKFKKAKIEEVMRQLSRWYNVDVSYPKGIPQTVFTGEMIKDANASQILDMLAYFNVNYEIAQQAKITEKKIIIKP